ncbi:MAG: hypothetical protein LLG06_10025 [Desulfobacteraceae bacterium]|nr:hypothetical protein [Desulfobacteraceae bacterium]
MAGGEGVCATSDCPPCSEGVYCAYFSTSEQAFYGFQAWCAAHNITMGDINLGAVNINNYPNWAARKGSSAAGYSQLFFFYPRTNPELVTVGTQEMTEAELASAISAAISAGNSLALQYAADAVNTFALLNKKNPSSLEEDIVGAINSLKTSLLDKLSPGQKTNLDSEVGKVTQNQPNVLPNLPSPYPVTVQNAVEVSKLPKADIAEGLKEWQDPTAWSGDFTSNAGEQWQAETDPTQAGGTQFDTQKDKVSDVLDQYSEGLKNSQVFGLTNDIGIDVGSSDSMLCFPGFWGGSDTCIDMAQWAGIIQGLGSILYACACICGVFLIFL